MKGCETTIAVAYIQEAKIVNVPKIITCFEHMDFLNCALTITLHYIIRMLVFLQVYNMVTQHAELGQP